MPITVPITNNFISFPRLTSFSLNLLEFQLRAFTHRNSTERKQVEKRTVFKRRSTAHYFKFASFFKRAWYGKF